jgi:predicted DNA-binding transcriptional regulator AlpA
MPPSDFGAIASRLCTLDEEAKRRGITRQWAYLLYRMGELPAVKIGHKVVVIRPATDPVEAAA